MTDGQPQFRETTRRFGLLRLDVEVHGLRLGVRLRPFQQTFRWFPPEEVGDVRVTTYNPSTYGGWHWGHRRAPAGNVVYRLHGDDGVELTLVDGRRVFIGSRKPVELHAALVQTR